MATLEEFEAELTQINVHTNEIASDMQDLIDRLAAGGLTEQEEADVLAQLSAHKTALEGIASQHSP